MISVITFLGLNRVRSSEPSILFIGNSMLAFNKTVPGVIKELVPSADLVLHYSGGAKLEDHWRLGKALAKIKMKKWDYVILQESSWVPYTNPDLSTEYIKMFDDKITKSGAKTILFMTAPYHAELWKKEGDENYRIHKMKTMADKTVHFYNSIIEESSIESVIPVGLTYISYMAFTGDSIPSDDLYHRDKSHPSEKGTLLSALTVIESMQMKPSEIKIKEVLEKYDFSAEIVEDIVYSKSYYHLSSSKIDSE